MVSQLTDDLKSIGKYSADAVDAEVARADIGEIVQTINEYDVTADPEKNRYIVSDDQHQYAVSIQHVNMGGEAEVAAYIEEAQTGFSNETLKRTNVLKEDDIEVDPRDGAAYADGNDGLAAAASRAPDRTGNEVREKPGEILEPETETGWGPADKL